MKDNYKRKFMETIKGFCDIIEQVFNCECKVESIMDYMSIYPIIRVIVKTRTDDILSFNLRNYQRYVYDNNNMDGVMYELEMMYIDISKKIYDCVIKNPRRNHTHHIMDMGYSIYGVDMGYESQSTPSPDEDKFLDDENISDDDMYMERVGG